MGYTQHSAVSMDRTLVSSCFSGGPILEKMLHFFFAWWMLCSLEIGFLCVTLCFISVTPLLRLQGGWWTCAHAGGAGVHVGGSSCGLQTGRRLLCCVAFCALACELNANPMRFGNCVSRFGEPPELPPRRLPLPRASRGCATARFHHPGSTAPSSL